MKEKAVKFVKYTSNYIFVLAFAIIAGFAWLSFSFTSEASSDTSVWHVGAVSEKSIGGQTLPSAVSSYNLNYDTTISPATLISSYEIPAEYAEEGNPLVLTYSSLTYSLKMYVARSMYPSEKILVSSSRLGNIKPCLIDNLGNQYPLDSTSGGTVVIDDISGITTLSLYFVGHVSGTQSFTSTGYTIKFVKTYANISAFDITLSIPTFARTITDSEGTVWTVPAEVENPVVISSGDVWTYLFDASDLKYITRDNGFYFLVSEDITTVQFYDKKGQPYTTFTLDILNQNYSIPFYLTSLSFDEFLYGTLPELNLVSPPLPSPDPVPDGDFEVLNVLESKVDTTSSPDGYLYSYSVDNPQRDWYASWSPNRKPFQVTSSYKTTTSISSNNNIYHTHYDEVESYPLTVFTSGFARYDGYCVISFPDGFDFKEVGEPGISFPSGDEDIISSWYEVRIIPYLLVQGVRYEISPFGCQFSFPVYAGESVSFLIGYEAHIQANIESSVPVLGHFTFNYEPYEYDIAVWYYQDNNELSQILDALEHFPGADQMDKDKSDLDSAIGDYEEAEDSLFESANEGIGNFDITTGLEFNVHILSAITFLSTVLSNIILAMGDYSVLYTIGACMVVVCILLGLYKFFGGDD